MPSVKLTAGIRNQILRAVLKHRFREELDKLVEDAAYLAALVYADVYPKRDREMMAALPSGWLPTVNAIKVQFGDSNLRSNFVSLNFNGSSQIIGDLCAVVGLIEQTPMLVPSKDVRRCAKVYPLDHKFHANWDSLEARKTTLLEQVKEVSHATLGALTTNWPEIEPFATRFLERGAPVPALPTTQLNDMLKLPVPETT